jgi:hypothetical protein
MRTWQFRLIWASPPTGPVAKSNRAGHLPFVKQDQIHYVVELVDYIYTYTHILKLINDFLMYTHDNV